MSFDIPSTVIGSDKKKPGMGYTEEVDRSALLDRIFSSASSCDSRSEDGVEKRGRVSYSRIQRSGVGVNSCEDSFQFPSHIVDRLDRLEVVLTGLMKKQERNASDNRRRVRRRSEAPREREKRREVRVQHGGESGVHNKHIRFVYSGKDGSRRVVDGRGQSRPGLFGLWFGGSTSTLRSRKSA